jgi:hypothetical protein
MFRHLIEEARSLCEVARLTRLQAYDDKRSATSAYDSSTGGSNERWGKKHQDAAAKAKKAASSSERAAKLSKGKNFKQHQGHANDAESARKQQAGLATVKDRIQHGDSHSGLDRRSRKLDGSYGPKE